jgi:hypothetical protein
VLLIRIGTFRALVDDKAFGYGMCPGADEYVQVA